jgi:hypothetical protein
MADHHGHPRVDQTRQRRGIRRPDLYMHDPRIGKRRRIVPEDFAGPDDQADLLDRAVDRTSPSGVASHIAPSWPALIELTKLLGRPSATV